MPQINIMDIFSNINGTTFASIDTDVNYDLKKKVEVLFNKENNLSIKIDNPFYGNVRRISTGISVMLFSNTNCNGYENLVNRRSVKEGIEGNFNVGKPVWGTRIKSTPIIEHNGVHYLEVIYQKSGTTEYKFLDKGKLLDIDFDLILGKIKTSTKPEQNGIENKIILRRYKLSSLKEIRANNQTYTGEFVYS